MDVVVVGGMPLGEADRLVRFLCAERGRGAAVARGARRSRKRFGGLLELGTRLDIDLSRTRGSLEAIASATARGFPLRARTSLDRIALLTYGCELCASLAGEGEPAPRLTRLLEVWLDLLEGEATPGLASRLALEAKALTFAGLAPQLVRCGACGLRLDDPAVFDPGSGGAQHHHCGTGQIVPADTLRTLEALRRTPLARTLEVAEPALRAHRWLLSGFIRYQLGKELRSRTMLEESG